MDLTNAGSKEERQPVPAGKKAGKVTPADTSSIKTGFHTFRDTFPFFRSCAYRGRDQAQPLCPHHSDSDPDPDTSDCWFLISELLRMTFPGVNRLSARRNRRADPLRIFLYGAEWWDTVRLFL